MNESTVDGNKTLKPRKIIKRIVKKRPVSIDNSKEIEIAKSNDILVIKE